MFSSNGDKLEINISVSYFIFLSDIIKKECDISVEMMDIILSYKVWICQKNMYVRGLCEVFALESTFPEENYFLRKL